MNLFFILNSLKRGKKGEFYRSGPGCDVARKATWQSHASPRGCLRGAEVARTRGSATRDHADARVAQRGSVRGLRVMGGLVGSGKSIGAVTQMRYAAPRFILEKSSLFLHVGLCSILLFLFQVIRRCLRRPIT